MSSKRRLRRHGYAPMTPVMMQALIQLSAQDDVGYVWLDLADVHGNSKNAMRKRDWIVMSNGIDGTKYHITTRGVKALKHYQKTLRRKDGICPDCGINPVAYSADGKKQKYCRECYRKIGRRKNKRNMRRYGQLCPTCKERERYVMPCGKVSAHCQECRRIASSKAYYRRKQAQAHDSQ
jgi:hypothetical protein